MQGNDDLDAPVSRREFEARMDALAASVHELKDELAKRSPGLGNVLTLVAMGVTVVVTTVQSFSRVNSLEEWRAAHGRFSEEKAGALDSAVSDLRSRLRALEKAIEEQEMQHRWMADVTNLRDQELERLLRLKHPEVPASDYWPLGEIGRAVGASGGQ